MGDAEGISKLATLAKEEGKNNVAFLCLFMLGKLEDCLQLLVERYYSIVVIYILQSLYNSCLICLNYLIDCSKYFLCFSKLLYFISNKIILM